jgi:membrane protein YdbS with pleckstrin-like domain
MSLFFSICLGVALLTVIMSSRCSSRAGTFAMAAMVPFIFAMILAFVAMIFFYDEPHGPGWPALGSGIFFLKLLIPCLIAAAVCEWRKARQS